MCKIIYLAAGRAVLNHDHVVYNDYKERRDLVCDMLTVDLSAFDVLIATPPCNYYSRANHVRETSTYAQQTRHLLPSIIDKFIKTGKPFLVENVRNEPLFKKSGLYNKSCLIYKHGRHTYWTNVPFNPQGIKQTFDFKQVPGYGCVRLRSYVQGGENVNNVIDYFIDVVKATVLKETTGHED